MLCKFWIDFYAGAPDYITTGAEINFSSQAFEDSAEAMGSIVRIVTVKILGRIGTVERNHAYLRTDYDTLRIDMPYLRQEKRLAMTFRAMNDSPKSESGVSPTMLVFGINQKIPSGICRGTMIETANIIKDCTKIVTKMKAKRTIRDASRQKNSPSLEDIQKVSKLPRGHTVLVYR